MKILLTGGGSGGHIIPLLAVVSEIEKIAEEKNIEKLEFLLISPDGNFNDSLLERGIQVQKIAAGKLRRYFSWDNLSDLFRIPIGIVQSIHYVLKFKPDVVFSKGGFASVPPVFAGWLLGVPIITHESDIVPGLANKTISFFAKVVLVSFPGTEKFFSGKKVILTGNPIRRDILSGDKERAKDFFDLRENFPTILVYGGSQGSKRINEVIKESLPVILNKYQVIHICGENNYGKMKDETDRMALENKKRYKAYAFLSDEMKDAYALSDLVVSRAGANSLSEIIAVEKPNIVIPLPGSANNHQEMNAEYFAGKHISAVIYEKDLTSERLAGELDEVLSKKEEILKNIRAYKDLTIKDSAKMIAGEIFGILGRKNFD